MEFEMCVNEMLGTCFEYASEIFLRSNMEFLSKIGTLFEKILIA